MTRWKWLRMMVEHEIHHRGQLYTMLGMIDVVDAAALRDELPDRFGRERRTEPSHGSVGRAIASHAGAIPLPLTVTYIGGPTALIEIGGLRLLIDPTFDPAGTEYRTPAYVLRKTQGPGCFTGRISGRRISCC